MARRKTAPSSWVFHSLLLLLMLGACSNEKEASAELAALKDAHDAAEGTAVEKRAAFAPRYRALAREYWGTDAALEAALWLMDKAARETGGEARVAIVAEYSDSIMREYADSPGLERWADLASAFTHERIAGYLEELREASPHPAVRAAAIYYPVRRELLSLRSPFGAPAPRVPVALEADLRLLIAEYGGVPLGNATYGIMADAHLNAHALEDLAIGSPAPEILGRTMDGEEMRLSDFRGKVTVLTFWGDW